MNIEYWNPPLSEITAFLTERGYQGWLAADWQAYQHLYQKPSGIKKYLPDNDSMCGYVDVRVYDLKALKIPPTYEIGATFETAHGWIHQYFYGLCGRDVLTRLPVLEGEIRAMQERLMGEQIALPEPQETP